MCNKIFLTLFFCVLNLLIYRYVPFKFKRLQLLLILGLVIPLFSTITASLYTFLFSHRFFPLDTLFVLLFVLSLLNVYRYYLSKIFIQDMEIGSERISLPSTTGKFYRIRIHSMITIFQCFLIWRDSNLLLSILEK
jgi:hypothetical protein